MKKNSFLKNKYTVLLCFVLLLPGTDVLLHKGMARYLLPSYLPEYTSFSHLVPVQQEFVVDNKDWKKAVNSSTLINALPANTGGIEMDVYFDTAQNNFLVYHDTTVMSNTTLEQLLQVYKRNNLSASLWLDFKNLSTTNQQQALMRLVHLRNQFGLQQKILVEATHPQCLQAFNKEQFFTSYYVPYFNPYQTKESELLQHIDSIGNTLRQFNVAAVSGYYFQMPALKKYFPSYPQLTWVARQRVSLVSILFRKKLFNDPSVKVVLQ